MSAQLPTPPSSSPSSSPSPSLPPDWALWQLLDSALPTGGFAHSLGVESASRSGLVSDPPSLSRFISCMLEGHAALQLPFVSAAHAVVAAAQLGAREEDEEASAGGGGAAVAAQSTQDPAARVVAMGAAAGGATVGAAAGGATDGAAAGGATDGAAAGGATVGAAAGAAVKPEGDTDGLETDFLLHLLQPMVDHHVAARQFVEALAIADSALNCMMLCDVARQVSLSQGSALLRVACSLFPDSWLLADYRKRIRRQASEEEQAKAVASAGSGGGRAERGRDSANRTAEDSGSVGFKASDDASRLPPVPPPSNTPPLPLHSSSSSSLPLPSLTPPTTDSAAPRAFGHLAITFGAVTAAAQISASLAQRAFVFCALRDSLSAATRLGLIGPMEAARMLRQLSGTAEAAVLRWQNRPIDDARQVSPVVEILQGCHVALSSRLFLS